MNRNMSITTALLLSNIAVFVLGSALPQVPAIYGVPYPTSPYDEAILTVRGAFSWYTCFMEGEYWRLITYQFLHANTMHLVFNMWALYFFGPAVEEAMGARRYLAFYLACGVAGALFSSLLGSMGLYGAEEAGESVILNHLAQYTGQPDLQLWEIVPMVGASAAIYGVLVAVAYMYPHLRIRLIFPPIAMTMRTFAMVVLGLAVLTIILQGQNAGGEAGHLGGIIMAAIIMSIWKWRYLRRRRDDGVF